MRGPGAGGLGVILFKNGFGLGATSEPGKLEQSLLGSGEAIDVVSSLLRGLE